MPDEDVIIDGTKQGTWSHDCKTGKNDVTLGFMMVSIEVAITTGGQDIAQAVGDVAKGAVTVLKLAPETEQAIKDGIDTMVKLAPGTSIRVKGGWFVDKEAPRCQKGPDPARYLSYKVFKGVIIHGSGKIGPAGLDGAVRIGTDKAFGYHPCSCTDEVASNTHFLGGEDLALFDQAAETVTEIGQPVPIAIAPPVPIAIAESEKIAELYRHIGELTVECEALRRHKNRA